MEGSGAQLFHKNCGRAGELPETHPGTFIWLAELEWAHRAPRSWEFSFW